MAIDSSELWHRVDEVLYYVWDPIGVSNEPCARGEYRGYIPLILGLLQASADPAPIAERLAALVRDQMGLPADKVRCRRVAQLLLEHKRAVEEGLA